MTSSSPMQPLRIETLTPQTHGFIRAYVWQVYRGTDPVIGDDPEQQTALLVARAMVRIGGRDREALRRLTQELGAYMGAANPRRSAPSEAFQKLVAEFGGSQTEPVAEPEAPAAAASVSVSHGEKAQRAIVRDEAEHEAPPAVIHASPVTPAPRDLAEPTVETAPAPVAAPEPIRELEVPAEIPEIEPEPAPLVESTPEAAIHEAAPADDIEQKTAVTFDEPSDEHADPSQPSQPSPTDGENHSDETSNS